MENVTLEAVARELTLLLQARLDAPWSHYEAARYAELCKMELEIAREGRAAYKQDESSSRMAEIAAIRRTELDLNIERMREELEEREGFSALRAPVRGVRKTRTAPAT